MAFGQQSEDTRAHQRFLLFDHLIKAVTNDGRLADAVDFVATSVGARAVDSGDEGPSIAFNLVFTSALPELPKTARRYADLSHGISAWYDQHHVFVHHTNGLMELDIASGTGIGHFLQSGRSLAPETLLILTLSLSLLLSRFELYAIHAACVCHPIGRGYMLIGPSGSGKSTVSYCLVRAGWRYLSDDSLVLRDVGTRIEALPFRRNFYVDERTREIFPELGRAIKEQSEFNEDKWRVDLERLYGGQRAELCEPYTLLFSSISTKAESRLYPIEKKQALLRILPQAGIVLDPDPPRASRRLELLRKLVDQTESYCLEAGQDVLDDPIRVSELLTQAGS